MDHVTAFAMLLCKNGLLPKLGGVSVFPQCDASIGFAQVTDPDRNPSADICIIPVVDVFFKMCSDEKRGEGFSQTGLFISPLTAAPKTRRRQTLSLHLTQEQNRELNTYKKVIGHQFESFSSSLCGTFPQASDGVCCF